MNARVRRLAWWSVTVLFVAGVVVALGLLVLQWLNYKPVATHFEKIVTKPAVVPTSISSKALFMGDVFWGRYINDWSQKSPLKTAYPFSRLNEFHRDQYDAWVADLECPSVNGVHMTSAEEDATLTFNCSPDYLPEAAKWFTIFSDANNHSDNQGGQKGIDETRQHLDENHIQYFGNADPEILKDVCEVVSFPVTVTNSDKTTKKGAIPVALCGYHGVFKIPSAASLAVMKQYAPYMPVIAYPHSGAEYQPAPDEIKTTLYRAMIDNGADVVLGDHPHWIQNTESYKGHLIVYSMGNFIFDQQFNTEVTRSAPISLKLSLDSRVNSKDLEQWLKIGGNCSNFQDTCLEQIKSANLKKLPFSYQFGVVGSNDSDKIAKPATAEQRASILQRLNWQTTITQLKQPYSGIL